MFCCENLRLVLYVDHTLMSTIYLNVVVDQEHPCMAMIFQWQCFLSFIRIITNHTTLQVLFENGLQGTRKSPRCCPGLQSPISIQLSISGLCCMYSKSGPWWLYYATSEVQGSAGHVLVPDTTEHLQRSCSDQGLPGKSCFSST